EFTLQSPNHGRFLLHLAPLLRGFLFGKSGCPCTLLQHKPLTGQFLRLSSNRFTRLSLRYRRCTGTLVYLGYVDPGIRGERLKARQKGAAMSTRAFAMLLTGLLLGGCMQGTLEGVSDANFTARDRKLLANAPYARANVAMQYQKQIVSFHRQEAPGSIVVDS